MTLGTFFLDLGYPLPYVLQNLHLLIFVCDMLYWCMGVLLVQPTLSSTVNSKLHFAIDR
jgi:hypothetical protein